MTALHVAPDVADAVAAGRAVVALESSLIAHGLPPPHNLDVVLRAEAAIRESAALPATIALDGGRIVVGADASLIERLADPATAAAKAASRDIGPLVASRRLGATTVSATLRVMHMAGIRVLATGGIGGVHRGAAASFDVSSDIDELASTPAAVVCSGAKSILDLSATLELLETRRVPVVGVGTDELPAFYSARSGLSLEHRVDDAAEAAAMTAAHLGIPAGGAIVFVVPPPHDVALDARGLESLIERAVEEIQREGVTGARVTPAILARMAELSAGATLAANIGLIVNNARFAGRLAVELAARKG